MITENTVFILGAGGSCPYGYPTGMRLKDLICDKKNIEKLYSDFFIKTKLNKRKKSDILEEKKQIDSFY